MMKIDLNTQKEMEPILEFKTGSVYIDIHNDYKVQKVIVNDKELEIYLIKSIPTANYSPISKYEFLRIVFIDFKLEEKIDLLLMEGGNSFDNLCRSSYHSDKYYYIISFTEGEEYNIECSDAFIEEC